MLNNDLIRDHPLVDYHYDYWEECDWHHNQIVHYSIPSQPLTTTLANLFGFLWQRRGDLCSTCSTIDFQAVFRGEGKVNNTRLRYGQIHQRRAHLCPFCCILQEITSILIRDPIPWSAYARDEWIVERQKGQLILYYAGVRRGQIKEHKEKRNEDSRTSTDNDQCLQPDNKTYSSTQIERQFLDIKLVKEWLHICETAHDSKCQQLWPSERYKQAADLILIDVKEAKLVKASTKSRYVALSYVWGGVQGLQATSKTFAKLQQPESLTARVDEIPAVLHGAMKLVEQLSERYLWSDALCIIQDETAQKQEAIMNMDLVYGNALLTIVAANGFSANEGLPGVNSVPRPLLACGGTIDGIPVIWTPPELQETLHISAYETRAWTFQERLLSPRCLYLSHSQAYFHCPSSYECEDYHDHRFSEPFEYRRPHPRNPLFRLREVSTLSILQGSSLWSSNIYTYARLVRIFSERDLTHISDRLSAFQGVLSVLQEVCSTRITCAIPEEVIDLALLWTPTRYSSGLFLEKLPFPSWSWLSWSEPTSYRKIFPLHVIPEADQILGVGISALDNAKILSKYLTDEEMRACEKFEFKLKSEIDAFFLDSEGEVRKIQRREAGRLYDTAADENSQPPASHWSGQSLSLQHHLLRFDAYTIPADVFDVYPGTTHLQYGGNITLFLKGKACGVLMEDFDRFEGLRGREFVLLSSMPGKETLAEHWYDEALYKCKGWYICNVMLTEKTGSVARRVALGMMHKAVWDLATATVPKQHVILS